MESREFRNFSPQLTKLELAPQNLCKRGSVVLYTPFTKPQTQRQDWALYTQGEVGSYKIQDLFLPLAQGNKQAVTASKHQAGDTLHWTEIHSQNLAHARRMILL
jgi:hypothetical protein